MRHDPSTDFAYPNYYYDDYYYYYYYYYDYV